MSQAHIDHIGIIVADIEAAVERFRPLLGEADPIRELTDYGLRVAMIETANVTIELLQYTGEGDDFARGVMGEREVVRGGKTQLSVVSCVTSRAFELSCGLFKSTTFE